jgi:ubiquinone/menaquinone biosynthesis C-methylase UbiE
MSTTDRIENYSKENSLQHEALIDSFTPERYAQFARYLPATAKKILDVGCAEGRGGVELKKLRPDIELGGLDCVAERLTALPPAYTSNVHGLTTSIPADDLTYDAIVAGEFLEHLYPSDVDPTLCEFQRILKVGGYLMMTTPNPNSLKLRWNKGSVLGASHLTQHYPNLLKQRLLMHGFNHVRLLGSGKAIRKFGDRFPCLSLYGSFLVIAEKR